jgi:hypothetical protein
MDPYSVDLVIYFIDASVISAPTDDYDDHIVLHLAGLAQIPWG